MDVDKLSKFIELAYNYSNQFLSRYIVLILKNYIISWLYSLFWL